ncbi:MAG: hypothetical protein J7599_07680 [Niabella sp.]|nr:hypothetical protein [Niabella sp.]
MKLKLCIITLITLYYSAYRLGAQEKLQVTDSTVIIGVVQDFGAFAEKVGTKSNIFLRAGASVLIGYLSPKTDKEYAVYYLGDKYYVRTSDIKTLYPNLPIELSKLSEKERAILDSNALRMIPASIEYENRQADIMYKKRQDNKAKFLNELRKKGLGVLTYSVYKESEYTKGKGFKIDVINTSNKIIKYLTFNFTGINPVWDPVDTKIRKGIGPILPNETGSYKFEYVWFTDIVDQVRLNSIIIQYMDNTKKILSRSDISVVPYDIADLTSE